MTWKLIALCYRSCLKVTHLSNTTLKLRLASSPGAVNTTSSWKKTNMNYSLSPQTRVHILTQTNQFSASSVKVFKHSATWQGLVRRFNPSRRLLTSDLTDAVVKGPSLHVSQSIQVPLLVICPSKLKTAPCYMANILNQTLFQSLFADYSKPICHLWQCAAATLR